VYSSPKVLFGDDYGFEQGFEADLWAFGVILSEMIPLEAVTLMRLSTLSRGPSEDRTVPERQ
jgi:hypothetical protein